MEKFRVKKVENWIEVYLPLKDRRRKFSYAMGFVDDGVLVITDVFLSPGYRKKGLGRRIVQRLIKEAGAQEVRVNNIQESARGFWNRLQLEEEVDRRRIRRIERKRSEYLTNEGYD